MVAVSVRPLAVVAVITTCPALADAMAVTRPLSETGTRPGSDEVQTTKEFVAESESVTTALSWTVDT